MMKKKQKCVHVFGTKLFLSHIREKIELVVVSKSEEIRGHGS